MLRLAKELGTLFSFLGDSPGEELSALFIFLGGSATVMTGLFGSSGDPFLSRTDLGVLVSIGRIDVRQALARERALSRDSEVGLRAHAEAQANLGTYRFAIVIPHLANHP
jgi:hypothetical protein